MKISHIKNSSTSLPPDPQLAPSSPGSACWFTLKQSTFVPWASDTWPVVFSYSLRIIWLHLFRMSGIGKCTESRLVVAGLARLAHERHSLNCYELPGWIRAFSLFLPTRFWGLVYLRETRSSVPMKWSEEMYRLTKGKTAQKVETAQKSTVRWISKMWSIHTMKHDSAVKRKEAPTLATTQRNLKNAMLSLPSWSNG